MASIKTVGASGQIALGKEFAGRHVLVDELAPGVWVVKVGEFVPDSERWLFEARVKAELDEALAWAETHKPATTAIDALARRIAR